MDRYNQSHISRSRNCRLESCFSTIPEKKYLPSAASKGGSFRVVAAFVLVVLWEPSATAACGSSDEPIYAKKIYCGSILRPQLDYRYRFFFFRCNYDSQNSIEYFGIQGQPILCLVHTVQSVSLCGWQANIERS